MGEKLLVEQKISAGVNPVEEFPEITGHQNILKFSMRQGHIGVESFSKSLPIL